MSGLPIKIQIPCRDEFHDVVVTEKGRITFPAHRGVGDLERLINFEELGGRPTNGCHKVWLAWRNDSGSLPEKLAVYRKDHGHHLAGDRALRRRNSPGRRRAWGPPVLTPEAVTGLPKGKDAFRVAVLILVHRELLRRGYLSEWGPGIQAARRPERLGEIVRVMSGGRTTLCTVEADWFPPGSLSLTVTVDRSEQVNVVRTRNEARAVARACDLVGRVLAERRFRDSASSSSSSADEVRKEDLLRRVSRINGGPETPESFFRVTPTAVLDAMAVVGSVPGPLTDAAARLALARLNALSSGLQRLRVLSAARLVGRSGRPEGPETQTPETREQ